MLFIFLIVLMVIGAGIGLALVSAAAAWVLVLMGIVSTSLVMGILRRSLGAGVRSFVYQGAAVAGAVAGLGIGFFVRWLLANSWTNGMTALIGAGAGLAGGLVLAAILVFAVSATIRFIQTRSHALSGS